MARFLKHTSCPKCGSRDNLGVYDDESKWCFGCGYYENPKISPLVSKALHGNDSVSGSRALPSDASSHFGNVALDWLKKYDIPIETLIKRGVRWSEEWQQLLFTFDDFWQARNFKHGKSKYFTSKQHDDLLPIYFSSSKLERNLDLVITEDCLSAIKVAETAVEGATFDAMPLLGSHLPTQKLNRLNRLYSRLVVWLDHDKGKEAMDIAHKAKLLGMESFLVVTDVDPKETAYEEISRLLAEKA